MRPGMACLLALLRGETGLRRFPEAAWLQALALAQEERVAPFCAALLRAARKSADKPEASPALESMLAAIEREAAIQAFWWSAQLQSLLTAFAQARLDVLPLKGPSLAKRLYGGAALRTCRDLDLLVRRKDLPAAERLLRSLGFEPRGHGDDYHRTWLRATTAVELHFDVENPLAFNFDIRAVWQRAALASFQGQPAWQLAPADELAFLCLHATRHRFERLSHVLDIALMLAHAQDLGRVRQPAPMQPVVELGCLMAAHLTPGQPAPQDAGRTVPAHPQALAASLWSELLTQAPAPADWQSKHRFFLQLEPTRIARLLRRGRHVRILLSRLIDADYNFAESLGLRRTWQVRLLRPLRLCLGRPQPAQPRRPARTHLGSTPAPLSGRADIMSGENHAFSPEIALTRRVLRYAGFSEP